MIDPFAPPSNDLRCAAFREARAAHMQRIAEDSHVLTREANAMKGHSDDTARAAVKADRERMAQILESSEAQRAPLLAAELAFNTDESAESALGILRAAVAPTKRQAATSKSSVAPSAENVAAGWDAAIEHVNGNHARYTGGAATKAPEPAAADTPVEAGDGWSEAVDALNGGRR